MGFLSLIGLIIVLKSIVYFVLFFTGDSDLELWWYDKFNRNLGNNIICFIFIIFLIVQTNKIIHFIKLLFSTIYTINKNI